MYYLLFTPRSERNQEKIAKPMLMAHWPKQQQCGNDDRQCVTDMDNMAGSTGEEGLEPPTDYLEGSCSIQLSYSPTLAPYPNILLH
jgi:hypothetical protein